MSGRVALVVLALALGAASFAVSTRGTVPAPWLEAWTPDPRALTEVEQARLMEEIGRQRRSDLVWLLAGLAAGCAVLAWRPAPRGERLAAVLVGGSILVGLAQLGLSSGDLVGLARSGEWSPGDDAFSIMAREHASTLRAWRGSTTWSCGRCTRARSTRSSCGSSRP
jgi:hypothetical protein